MGIPALNRADFQLLSDTRLEEAKLLLDNGKWSGAYYLAGYAVEVALKACIIKRLMATDAFPERRFSEKCYTHNLEALVELAGLTSDLANATANPSFEENWKVTCRWSEQKRYDFIEEFEARRMFEAITDASFGVLPWIKTLW
jgi:HEPN domain-containing protein